MAFYSALRRASSSVLPLAVRAVGSPRSFHGAISAVRSLQNANLRSELARQSFVPFLRFSTAVKKTADENLLSVLESEINCGEEIEGQNTFDGVPKEFPFKIHDNPGERTIFLTRKFDDETIKVEVDIPNLSVDVDGEEDADADADADADTQESTNHSSIPLVVSISKGNGVQLEFGITAFPEEFTIDSLSIKKPDGSEDQLAYEGPDFNDLDENFQKAFYSYLEVRGINPSTLSFLHEYMVSKEGKEYMNWLRNLKNFVEH